MLEEFKFVGRGGYKLDSTVNYFKIDFRGKIIADVGCSRGGFTDYALKHEAKKIYSIDIGNPLDENLRKNKKLFICQILMQEI